MCRHADRWAATDSCTLPVLAQRMNATVLMIGGCANLNTCFIPGCSLLCLTDCASQESSSVDYMSHV